MTFARNDSKVFHFCRRKCNQMFKKRINPRKVAWTKDYRKVRGKELAMDTTFDLEKKKNVPVKYDRELYSATIKAMKRIKEIQMARQRAFYFNRMKPALKLQKMRLKATVEKGKDLLVAPIVAKKKAMMKDEIIEEDLDEEKEEVKPKKPLKSALKKKKVQQIEEQESD